MTILDTHAWIWWVNESPQLSPAAQGAMETANDLGVHLISCWEVAMLVDKGRLGLRLDIDQWVDEALRRPKITLLPFTPPHGCTRDPITRRLSRRSRRPLYCRFLFAFGGQSRHPRRQD
jgi:PIN domain nuclease of toxin-antitoxin system